MQPVTADSWRTLYGAFHPASGEFFAQPRQMDVRIIAAGRSKIASIPYAFRVTDKERTMTIAEDFCAQFPCLPFYARAADIHAEATA